MLALDERERASGLSLSQIETFLALVEEGSMARASRKLGLGRSTLSAHIKALSDEFNQRLFVRVHGGLAITPAGIEAYEQLRPLMARAGYCVAYFRAAETAQPEIVTVSIAKGFSGALIDQAVDALGKRVIEHALTTWVLPAYNAEHGDRSGLELQFGGLQPPGKSSPSTVSIRDRWIVVKSGTEVGWSKETVQLADLTDLTITVPKLPDAQLSLLLSLAEKVQARVNFTSLDVHEILAEATLNQNFCFMMPAALLNPSLVSQQFACAVLEQSELDPVITISGAHGDTIGKSLADHLSQLVECVVSGA